MVAVDGETLEGYAIGPQAHHCVGSTFTATPSDRGDRSAVGRSQGQVGFVEVDGFQIGAGPCLDDVAVCCCIDRCLEAGIPAILSDVTNGQTASTGAFQIRAEQIGDGRHRASDLTCCRAYRCTVPVTGCIDRSTVWIQIRHRCEGRPHNRVVVQTKDCRAIRCILGSVDDPENAIRRVRQQIVRHGGCVPIHCILHCDASVKPGDLVGRKGQVRESSREGVIGRRIVPPLDIDAVAIGLIGCTTLGEDVVGEEGGVVGAVLQVDNDPPGICVQSIVREAVVRNRCIRKLLNIDRCTVVRIRCVVRERVPGKGHIVQSSRVRAALTHING